MTDWDVDSKQLRDNLHQLLSVSLKHARQRRTPSVEQARGWQNKFMHGLTSPRPQYVGRFRGEPGLEGCEITVGSYPGVSSGDVAENLKRFEEKLQKTVAALDGLIKLDRDMSADDVAAVIDLCAWVHAEWIRIHPFANGNGRTARLWANSIEIGRASGRERV